MHGCKMSLRGCIKVQLQLAWIKKKSKTRFMRKVDVVRVVLRACRIKIALQTCVYDVLLYYTSFWGQV